MQVPQPSKLKEEDVWRLALQLGDQATFCNEDLAIMKQLMIFCCSRSVEVLVVLVRGDDDDDGDDDFEVKDGQHCS